MSPRVGTAERGLSFVVIGQTTAIPTWCIAVGLTTTQGRRFCCSCPLAGRPEDVRRSRSKQDRSCPISAFGRVWKALDRAEDLIQS